MCSRSAAREKLSSSATATKYRRCRSSATHGIMTRRVAIAGERVFLPHPALRTVRLDMHVQILSRAEVEQLLDLEALLDALRHGFKALTAGEVTAPGRNELTMPDEAFLLG